MVRQQPDAAEATPPAPTASDEPARSILLLLGALTALLFLLQYTTLANLGAMPPNKLYGTVDALWTAILNENVLGWKDAALAAGILAVSAGILALEIAQGRFTQTVAWVLASEKRTLVGLILTLSVVSRYYLAAGELSWAADSATHLTYAWIASRSIQMGELPIWTNYLAAGTPFCQFYGFAYFYIVGLASLVLRDLFLSIKLVLFLAHVASGVGTYRAARSGGHDRAGSALAGLAYALCFWHVQQVLVMGRMPVSLIYTFLPWLFHAVHLLTRPGTRAIRAVCLGALSLCLMTFVHPGYAFWSILFCSIYSAARAITCRRRDLVARAGLMLFTGVLAGAYLSVPMYLEREFTGLAEGIALSWQPDPTWAHLLSWSNYRYFPAGVDGNWYSGYLGLSIILAAGIAVYGMLTRTSGLSRTMPSFVCLAGSLILVFGYRWPILASSITHAFNAGRYLLFTSFFLCLLSAGAPIALARTWPSLRRTRACALLLILLAVDLGPTTFQQPYVLGQDQFLFDTDLRNTLNRAAEELGDKGRIPNQRLMHASPNFRGNQSVSWVTINTGHATVSGVYDEHPPSVWTFSHPIEKLLREGGSAELALSQALPLWLNTNLFATDNLDAQGAVRIAWAPLEPTTPIIVSAGLVPWDRQPTRQNPLTPSEIDTIAGYMSVTVDGFTCEAIPVLDLPAPVNLGAIPSVQVIDHRVSNQRVDLDIEVTASCFARLAYSWHPSLELQVNGNRVTPLRTAGSFLALRLDAGRHQITLRPRLSSLRFGLLCLTLLMAIGAIGWFCLPPSLKAKRAAIPV